MFSPQVEELIQASLVDGMLSEKERAVIKRMAMAEGADEDVVDVMLDARLAELRLQQQQQRSLHKCPYCGAEIDAFTKQCPDCGNSLRGSVVTSVKELNRRLDEITRQGLSEQEAQNARRTLIQTFPVPNTREDLLEFLSLSAANSKKTSSVSSSTFWQSIAAFFIAIISIVATIAVANSRKRSVTSTDVDNIRGLIGSTGGNSAERQRHEHNMLADVWRAKFQQCMTKARLIMSDPTDIATLDSLEKQMGIRKTQEAKKTTT